MVYLCFMRALLFLSLLLLPQTVFAGTALEQDKSAARIMVYFTIARDDAPSTNVTREQFEKHLKELTRGEYNVLPLPQIIAHYEKGEDLPPNTVALTFDGGDKSILYNAVPLLEAYKLPYTLFISSARADKNSAQYLNWKELKSLQKSKLATLGIHSHHYTTNTPKTAENIRSEINNATSRFREEIGSTAKLFAYPFGQYNQIYKDIVTEYGFKAAFGQQSGVAYAQADHFTLPRFTMTENYSDERRFKMTANALPLPTKDISPPLASTYIMKKSSAIGFTIQKGLSKDIHNLSCFAAGQEKPTIKILGNERVELRLSQPINQTRFRVNCTLPVNTQNNDKTTRWRWFGLLFTFDETFPKTSKDPVL